MPKIQILEEDLLDLLEDNTYSRTGFIDRQTGRVLMYFEGYDDPDEEDKDIIEQNPDRYLAIEPIDSHEGFRIMEKFVDSLPESAERDLLDKVLSWKKPFSNFKSALLDMGDLREQWFEFHDQEIRRLAIEWLESRKLDAELVPYAKASP